MQNKCKISPYIEKSMRVNNILLLQDICQSKFLIEELSIKNITYDPKRNKIFSHKTPYFKPTFQNSKYTN